LPGDLGASQIHPGAPMPGGTATALPPGANAITTAMVYSPDVGPRHTFSGTGGYALPVVPVQGPALIMTPREQIAPIGSEVVLIASYLGSRDRLITNEKIEWSLEGVGNIGNIDTGSHCDILHFDHTKARKVSDRYAITKTSSRYQTLDRGTPGTTDNINLLRGQTWVSVNSMREGTTHVTALAPNMADWSRRTDVGIVHWVDAQWVVPRLPIAPVGDSRVLTTTVLRASNGQPRQGWIVRYEILGGPAAGLGGTGAQVQEIETDFSGEATAILTPRDHQQGTNTIRIQIIRPAGLDGDRRVTVGSETVRQTWSGSPNILLNIDGPNEARLGQDLPYAITAENRTSVPVPGVIALPIPPLASYIRSDGILQGSTVLWNVTLPPNSTTRVNVTVRQGTSGVLRLSPEFHPTGQVTVPTPAPQQPFVPVPPSPPDQGGAIVFPGGASVPPTPPPVPDPPLTPPSLTPPPAQTFQQRPTLSAQIEPVPSTPIALGQPFQFYARVANTGTTDANNVQVFIQLPEEFRGREITADWSTDWNLLAAEGRRRSTEGKPTDWRVGIDPPTNRAVVEVPVLAVGRTIYFLLEYPAIGPQGYNIVYIVLVNGQEVTRGDRTITP